jgi:hypothetical protein
MISEASLPLALSVAAILLLSLGYTVWRAYRRMIEGQVRLTRSLKNFVTQELDAPSQAAPLPACDVRKAA